MKTTIFLFVILATQVSADECKGKERVKLGQDLLMRCHNGVWKAVQRKSALVSKPCEDDSALAANGTCSADRGHCSQFTDKGAEMDRTCPGTCESCDACRCKDSHQWHTYCPYWIKYCDSTGVLGTWMTSNCRKTCGKCKCKCCSYKGKQHALGSRISLPEKCGVLECQESLIAKPSPLLPGAAVHNVSHPEELTLSFISLQDGADCCVLPHKARHSDGMSYDKDAMVEEGWSGSILMPKGPVKAFCCHGSLNVPLTDVDRVMPATPTATPAVCQAGWNQTGSACYRVFNNKLPWEQAQAACQNEGGNLASIEDAATNDFIFGLIEPKVRTYIGAYQPPGSPKDSGWKWSDSSAWGFEYWGRSHLSGGEYCGEMLDNKEWNDHPCAGAQQFVCKIQLTDAGRLPDTTITPATATPAAPSCQAGWNLYGNFCYRFFASGLNWFQARDACLKEKANLASIENSNENDFVLNLRTSGYHMWIGGSQPSGSPKDSGWTWTDNSAWTFENWGPNWDGNEHCLDMYKPNNGKWNDQTCTHVDTYVCKKHWTS